MNKENLIYAATELVRDLCILADNGVVLSKDKFHSLCEKQQFIDYLLLGENFPVKIRLDFFSRTSGIAQPETVDYVNDAFDRHANAIIMEDFGLKNNALYLAINIAVSVLQEAHNLDSKQTRLRA